LLRRGTCNWLAHHYPGRLRGRWPVEPAGKDPARPGPHGCRAEAGPEAGHRGAVRSRDRAACRCTMAC